MTLNLHLYLFSLFFATSCNSGKLTVVADLPSSLKETSAIEITPHSDLLWVIEDAGNKNHLYGLNIKGEIIKDKTIGNIQNIDWEDLTSDNDGNIYIGDFGNNTKKRNNFAIYKVSNPENADTNVNADVISFKLPKDMKSENFESFFLYEGWFYIFSKTFKKCKLFKVPNEVGNHIAEFISSYKLKGKHNRVTSADISKDGKTIVLLNHNKLLKITDFTTDNFFKGSIEAIKFDHNTQKEGICFKSNHQLFITDERTNFEGGNIYHFKMK